MKKVFIVAATWLTLMACTKADSLTDPVAANTIKATIDYMGNPAVDGYGWVLRLDTTFEIPTNLPDEFKQDELKVKVAFTRTSQVYPCHCPNPKQMVAITSITKE